MLYAKMSKANYKNSEMPKIINIKSHEAITLADLIQAITYLHTLNPETLNYKIWYKDLGAQVINNIEIDHERKEIIFSEIC